MAPEHLKKLSHAEELLRASLLPLSTAGIIIDFEG